jgi:hypothetical protein
VVMKNLQMKMIHSTNSSKSTSLAGNMLAIQPGRLCSGDEEPARGKWVHSRRTRHSSRHM